MPIFQAITAALLALTLAARTSAPKEPEAAATSRAAKAKQTKPPAAKSAAAKSAAAKPAAAKPGASKTAAKKPAAGKTEGGASVSQVVEKMQERYESAKDYRAKFAQRYTFAATGRERKSSGELLIKKPGRMLWQYKAPIAQMYLANGKTFWAYEPEEKQVFKQDLEASQLPAAVAFLMGKGKLSDEFEVTWAKELPYGSSKDHRLALKPKKPQSTYKAIYFVVDPETYLVRESVLINAQGDINALSFSDVKLDTEIPPKTFEWTVPKGVKVIDGAKRSAAAKALPASKP